MNVPADTFWNVVGTDDLRGYYGTNNFNFNLTNEDGTLSCSDNRLYFMTNNNQNTLKQADGYAFAFLDANSDTVDIFVLEWDADTMTFPSTGESMITMFGDAVFTFDGSSKEPETPFDIYAYVNNKYFTDLFVEDNNGEIAFTDSKVTYINMELASTGTLYFTYNGEYYISEIEIIDFQQGEILFKNTAKINTTEHSGKYVYYDYDGTHPTSKWRVLYDDNEHGLEIISEDIMGTKELGVNDSIIVNATDINGDDQINDIDKAIYSYNNIEGSVNSACAALITENTYKDSVRNIGFRNSINPNITYIQESDLYDEGDEADKTWFGPYSGKIRKPDTYYINDIRMMVALNLNEAGANSALRYIIATNYQLLNNDLELHIGNLNHVSDGVRTADIATIYDDSTTTNAYSVTANLRPVVKLNSNVSLTGEGTLESPYSLSE